MKQAFLLPNLITLCNLLSGCVAIVLAFHGYHAGSALFILLAAVFDFFDGLAARALNMKTLIGKDLDSLADVVSFGVAPSALLYNLYALSGEVPGPLLLGLPLLPYGSFLVAAMAAVRLAVFNNDPGQSNDFKGLPTPSTGIFIASIPLLMEYGEINPTGIGLENMASFILNPWFLLILTLAVAWLMIAPLRLFSLKFPDLSWKNNRLRFIFLFAVLTGFLIAGTGALFFVIPLYVISSLFFYRQAA